MKIRPVHPGDVEQVLIMWQAMMKESPRYCDKKFNPKKARAVLSSIFYSLGTPYLGLVVEDIDGALVGMLGAVMQEHQLFDCRYATDLGVYISPEHRGSSIIVRLIKEYEKWAIAEGAEEIALGVSTGVEMNRTVRVYDRLGYKLISHGMLKQEEE